MTQETKARKHYHRNPNYTDTTHFKFKEQNMSKLEFLQPTSVYKSVYHPNLNKVLESPNNKVDNII